METYDGRKIDYLLKLPSLTSTHLNHGNTVNIVLFTHQWYFNS